MRPGGRAAAAHVQARSGAAPWTHFTLLAAHRLRQLQPGWHQQPGPGFERIYVGLADASAASLQLVTQALQVLPEP